MQLACLRRGRGIQQDCSDRIARHLESVAISWWHRRRQSSRVLLEAGAWIKGSNAQSPENHCALKTNYYKWQLSSKKYLARWRPWFGFHPAPEQVWTKKLGDTGRAWVRPKYPHHLDRRHLMCFLPKLTDKQKLIKIGRSTYRLSIPFKTRLISSDKKLNSILDKFLSFFVPWAVWKFYR